MAHCACRMSMPSSYGPVLLSIECGHFYQMTVETRPGIISKMHLSHLLLRSSNSYMHTPRLAVRSKCDLADNDAVITPYVGELAMRITR